MVLVNRSTGEVLAERVKEAYSFRRRFLGLMFTKELPAGEGLHIRPCRSIHTFFMKYPIDVLYLSPELTIVGMEQRLRPMRVGKSFRDASSVVELAAGSIEKTQAEIGQTVWFQKNPKNI